MQKLFILLITVSFISCPEDVGEVSSVPELIYGTYSVEKIEIGSGFSYYPDWDIIANNNNSVKLIETAYPEDTIIMDVNIGELTILNQSFSDGTNHWSITGEGSFNYPVINMTMTYDYGTEIYNFTVTAHKQ